MSIEISALFDERLTDGDRAQLVLLDALSKNGECWVSDSRLAEIRRVSPRTVRRSMHNLAEYGFVELDNSQGVRRIVLRTQMSDTGTQMSEGRTLVSQPRTNLSADRTSMSGSGTSVSSEDAASPPHTPPVFRSLDPRDLDPDLERSRSLGDDPPPIVPPLVEAKPKRKRGKAAAEESPAFTAFWLAYPRHVARETARRAWDKLAPDETLIAEIMAGLESSKKTWKGKDLQYIPHATTWLNQRRWEDEQYGRTGNDNRYAEQHSQQHSQPFDWTGGRITPDDGTQFLEYVRRAREKSGRTGRHEEYDLSVLS